MAWAKTNSSNDEFGDDWLNLDRMNEIGVSVVEGADPSTFKWGITAQIFLDSTSSGSKFVRLAGKYETVDDANDAVRQIITAVDPTDYV